MPIYEYVCRACGKQFEELVLKASDEAGVVCPACGADGAERMLSACAAHVSGPGGGSAAHAAQAGGCAPPAPGVGGGGFR